MHLFHRKKDKKDKDGTTEDKDKHKENKDKDKDKDKAPKEHSSFFPSVFSSRQDPKPLPNVPPTKAAEPQKKVCFACLFLVHEKSR